MATTLSTCRWNWCTRTFPDHTALILHVEEDHIAKVFPVKRKDVPLLQRVEDGASLEESVPRPWAPDSDQSQSQLLATSRRLECAVMTDPVPPAIHTTIDLPPREEMSRRASSSRSGASTPTLSPRPAATENTQPTKFSEMRGTPSPAPSLFPASPSTGAIIDKMKQTSSSAVSPRRSPYTTPIPGPALAPPSPSIGAITSRMKQSTVFPVSPRRSPNNTPQPKPSPKPTPSNGTPRPRGLLPSPYFMSLADEDADGDGKGAVDPDTSLDIVESQLPSLDDADDYHGMDVDSAVSNGVHSQWQPQSQLSLPGSLENSSFPMSTIDPNQLHAPLSYPSDQQRMFREPGSQRGVSRGSSQSKILASPAAGSSHSQGTPRHSSSTPRPPSPSTLDISYVITVDSSQSVLRASSHGHAPPRVAQSPSSSTSKGSIAQGVSGLSQSTPKSQRSDRDDTELPFDSGFGYGYGDGYGDSQSLQTQMPLKQSSFESNSSQG